MAVIEDFERASPLDEYGGNTGNFGTETTNPINGSQSLTSTSAYGQIYRTDSVGDSARGNTYSIIFEHVDSANMFFGISSQSQAFAGDIDTDCYQAYVYDSFTNDTLRLNKRVSDSQTVLDSDTSIGWTGGTVYKMEFDFGSTGETNNLELRLYEDPNGTNTLVTTLTASDDTHSGGKWFIYGGSTTGFIFDDVGETALTTSETVAAVEPSGGGTVPSATQSGITTETTAEPSGGGTVPSALTEQAGTEVAVKASGGGTVPSAIIGAVTSVVGSPASGASTTVAATQTGTATRGTSEPSGASTAASATASGTRTVATSEPSGGGTAPVAGVYTVTGGQVGAIEPDGAGTATSATLTDRTATYGTTGPTGATYFIKSARVIAPVTMSSTEPSGAGSSGSAAVDGDGIAVVDFEAPGNGTVTDATVAATVSADPPEGVAADPSTTVGGTVVASKPSGETEVAATGTRISGTTTEDTAEPTGAGTAQSATTIRTVTVATREPRGDGLGKSGFVETFWSGPANEPSGAATADSASITGTGTFGTVSPAGETGVNASTTQRRTVESAVAPDGAGTTPSTVARGVGVVSAVGPTGASAVPASAAIAANYVYDRVFALDADYGKKVYLDATVDLGWRLV